MVGCSQSEAMDSVSDGFPAMRRRDRQLPEDAAIRILEEGEYGVLATCGEDDWPYGVPLSYVYHEGKLYFHGAKTGRKLDNLCFCDKASFTVVGRTHVLQEIYSTAYESVIAFGRVRPVEEEHRVEALVLLAEKYCYDNLEKARPYAEKSLSHVGVYCMEILHITGKKRPEQ